MGSKCSHQSGTANCLLAGPSATGCCEEAEQSFGRESLKFCWCLASAVTLLAGRGALAEAYVQRRQAQGGPPSWARFFAEAALRRAVA